MFEIVCGLRRYTALAEGVHLLVCFELGVGVRERGD